MLAVMLLLVYMIDGCCHHSHLVARSYHHLLVLTISAQSIFLIVLVCNSCTV